VPPGANNVLHNGYTYQRKKAEWGGQITLITPECVTVRGRHCSLQRYFQI